MDLLDGAALAVLVSLSVWYLKRFRLVTWMLRSLRMTVRLTCRTLRFTVRLCKRVAWLVAGASLIWISVAPRPEIIAGRVLVLSTLWGLWLYWRVQIHKAKSRQRAIAYRLPRRRAPT